MAEERMRRVHAQQFGLSVTSPRGGPREPLRHEAVPIPEIFVDSSPTYILDKRTKRVSEKAVQRENIMVAKVVTEMVRSTLGPYGMDKMIIDKEGVIWIVNDGSVILNKIDLEHPVAKLLAEAAKFIKKEVGDGTTSTVILAGELLKKSEELINKKVHPSVIINGYMDATEEALNLLRDAAITIDTENADMLKKIAIVAMSGRLDDGKETLANLAVDAILKIRNNTGNGFEVDLENIEIKKQLGESLGDSKLIEGMAYFKEIPDIRMPRRLENAKIAVIKGQLRIDMMGKTRQQEHKVQIESSDKLETYKNEVDKIFRSIVERVVTSGANVIIVEQGVEKALMYKFAKHGILALRRFSPWDIEKIARSVAAGSVSDIDYLTSEDIGFAKLVEHRNVGGRSWWFIEGCRNPKVLTILIRGSSEQLLNEAERATQNALYALRNILRRPKVVAGGGATEVEIAMAIKRWANQLNGRKQLVANSFSEALESIPITLAEVAGMDPIATITELRSYHVKGETHFGVDAFRKKVANMGEMGVYEPFVVKEKEIRSALEAATCILRIDDFMASRKLSKPEFYYQQRMEGQAPERMGKIKRDYGLD